MHEPDQSLISKVLGKAIKVFPKESLLPSIIGMRQILKLERGTSKRLIDYLN